MRLSRRYLFLVAMLAASAASLPAALGVETNPSIEAVNAGTSHYWSPSQASVAPGGKVTLSNATLIPHGVEWVGGPVKPTCEGSVPVGTTAAASGTKWSGNCTFAEAGTYTFYCTVHGPEMTGTITVTIPGAPTVTTTTASAVSETEATFKGTIDTQGKPTTYFFKYGTSTSYGSQTAEESAAEGSASSVSVPVGSLQPDTTYHFQLVAKNTSGTAFGDDEEFTTPAAPGAPTAITGVASALGETVATLKGTVNPDGEATKYLFEWGTTASYGHSTVEVAVGEDRLAHAASSALTGLLPGTVYHFRLVAKNASGTVPGLDGTFTTASPPPPPPPPPTNTTPTTSSPPPAAQVAAVTPPATTTLASTPSVPLSSALLVGSPSIVSTQHGTAVRGSLDVSSAGRGAHLEVDLLVKSGLLAKTAGLVRVGRLLRTSLPSGKLSFSVALSASAKRALARHRHLAVTVKITLTPAQGHALSSSRSVVLRS